MGIFKVKKSLRTRLTFFFLIGGLAPIIIGSTFFYLTTRRALFESVFKELRWTSGAITDVIEGNFRKAGSDTIFASANPAFKLYYTEHEKRDIWIAEQQKVLRNIRKLYKYLDESCFIERSGKEVSRIVYDTLAKEDELSPDESGRSFFRKDLRPCRGGSLRGKA